MYTLWRGGRFLGQFDERGPVTHHGKRVGSFGVLTPSEGLDGTASVMQARHAIPPYFPTFQHPLPVEWIGDSPERISPMYPSSGALEPLSPEAARGVLPDQLYEVRDERGAHVDIHLLTLQLHRFARASDAKAWCDANGIDDDASEFWMVSFASPPVGP
jgi:hypothetical protein